MKILYIIPTYKSYSEGWLHTMLAAIQDDVVLVAAGETNGLTHTATNIPVFELNRLQRGRGALAKMGLNGIAFRLKELKAEIKRLGVTHILCHYGNLAIHVQSLWRGTDIRAFVHFHGFDATFDLKQAGAPKKLYHPPGYAQKIIDLASGSTLIANSVHQQSLLVSAGVPASKVVVKYLGVEPKSRKLHSNDHEINVIAVGRLIDCKAPNLTIRAVSRAIEAGCKLRLHLIGDGYMRSECEDERLRCVEPERVIIHGSLETEKVRELFATSDIFTQHNVKGPKSNQVEAFGVSLLEAMAYGLPVVATRSGGPCEIVLDNETGYLVEPHSFEDQSDRLIQLAESAELRNNLGGKGFERLSSHFSAKIEQENLKSILAS